MTYVLDTSAAVAVIRNRPPIVRERLDSGLSHGHTIAISTITAFELWYRVSRSPRKEDSRALLQSFLSGRIELLVFDPDAAQLAGGIRQTLEEAGNKIGPYDLLIAAHALSVHATLVTGNTSEFGRVQGLMCEDWTKSN